MDSCCTALALLLLSCTAAVFGLSARCGSILARACAYLTRARYSHFLTPLRPAPSLHLLPFRVLPPQMQDILLLIFAGATAYFATLSMISVFALDDSVRRRLW